MKAGTFIDALKALDSRNETNQIYRFVYNRLNTAFHDGEFSEVDKVFSILQPSELSLDANVALMCYSGSAKSKLPARAIYLKAAFEDCLKRAPDRAYGIYGPML